MIFPFKEPKFWSKRGFCAYFLSPIGFLYQQATSLRQCLMTPQKMDIPVICVGNINIGGSGKTPLSIEIASYFKNQGANPHFILRGYGRQLKGTFQVRQNHNVQDVGDEALLLSKITPVWVADNRVEAAFLAQKEGATHLILDDGFQDPSLYKDLSICVIDGKRVFGNGFGIPAGPLRETMKAGLVRADAFCIMGDYNSKTLDLPTMKPIYEASFQIDLGEISEMQPLIAFAGIGNPKKFFEGLKSLNLIQAIPFPDHYVYKDADMKMLYDLAEREKAKLVTTVKDFVRLKDPKDVIFPMNARLEIKQRDAFTEMLNKVL
jgi:tetraacyldisaccharide 4'-kinase